MNMFVEQIEKKRAATEEWGVYQLQKSLKFKNSKMICESKTAKSRQTEQTVYRIKAIDCRRMRKRLLKLIHNLGSKLRVNR